jgi:hypothetical protein
MKQVFECSTCGVVTESKEHLCRPVAVAGMSDYCGQPVTKQTAMMCAEETARLAYECSSCGRTTEQPDLVCAPKKV